MQVASVLRGTLGLNHHRVAGVTSEDGSIVVTLDVVGRRLLTCSVCGTRGRLRDRLCQRRWRHLPVWEVPVELVYRPARVACGVCATPKVEAIAWSIGKSPLSRPLAVELATWSRLLAWDVVARLYGVAWATVVGAVEQAVAYGLERRDLSGLRVIGMDELSRRKGHVYHTNVYDIGSQPRRLIWSGEGRKKATLQRFFDDLGEQRAAQLEAVCCDMWANYVDVVRDRAPQAGLVFAKVHIVRHLGEAVNDVRKAEARRLRQVDPELLKNTRYIWLKNPGNLTDAQRLRLAELEKQHGLRTLRGYHLKELFRRLWNYKSKAWANKYLDRWFWWATHSRLEPMRDFAWMLRRHEAGVLAYFDHRIDNGAVEAKRPDQAHQADRPRVPQPHQLPDPTAAVLRPPRLARSSDRAHPRTLTTLNRVEIP
ncbi:MAG: ISL3 family transposase [Actinomycetota bacterium]|nr:ISL3 family transposase [Actinomycetota bacterium]